MATERTSGWTGWVFFAAIMMIMIGIFQGISGLVAIFRKSYYLVHSSGLVIHVNYTAWGWFHLIMGVIILLAGFGLMTGALWARVVAIFLALLSAVANLLFMPAYPVWSIIIITLDVFVIYAVAVHGEELREV